MSALGELVKELFANNSIGLQPERNENSADSYWCPCCGAHEDVKGYADGMRHISEIPHKPSCRLLFLYHLVTQPTDELHE